MLVCPRCGYYNSDVATHCDQCNAALSPANRERQSRPREAPAKLEAPAAVLAGDAPTLVCPGCGTEVSSRFCPECGRQLFSEPHYGGFWIRGGAALIDAFALFAVSVPIGLALSTGAQTIVLLIGYALYEIAFEVIAGATPGKMALGLRVVRSDFHALGWGRSIVRYIARDVEAFTFGIGLLLAAFNRRKRTLHDYIAGTIVIRER